MARLTPHTTGTAAKATTAKPAARPKKLSFKEQRELDELPAVIEALESEQRALASQAYGRRVPVRGLVEFGQPEVNEFCDQVAFLVLGQEDDYRIQSVARREECHGGCRQGEGG